MRLSWLAAFVCGTTLLTGCEPAYYAQLVRGHYDLLSRREPIEALLARPDLDPTLKVRLTRAVDARRFASSVLLLPDNGSYKQYADLQRPAALWNVFAAPEFSLAAHEWCYWITGCLAYRGYYELPAAKAEAAELQAEGLEVDISPVPAYSTLGWFDDPILNTILVSDDAMAGTIFHELAHQKRFVRGDTAFNESFASFVEDEGLREYFHSDPAFAASVEARLQHRGQFIALMLSARERLAAVYASGAPAPEMRARKAEVFARLRQDYAALKQGWSGYAGYDDWMAGELNNARLLPFGLYHHWVPAFAALFAQEQHNWAAFYVQVDALADLDAPARQRRLEELRQGAG